MSISLFGLRCVTHPASGHRRDSRTSCRRGGRPMVPALILSSDSHVFEPPDLWTTRIDAAFRDRAPRMQRTDGADQLVVEADRKSTRLNSSHLVISYAVFCLKKKKICQDHKQIDGEVLDEHDNSCQRCL